MVKIMRIRESADVRATIYQAANASIVTGETVSFDVDRWADIPSEGTEQRAAIEWSGEYRGPRGAWAYARLSAHCHAVARGGAECGAHDAHVATLQAWGAAPITDPKVWRVARWIVSVNGGTFPALSMSADDVIQETIGVLIEHAEPLTLDRVLAHVGRVLADTIDANDEAGEVWEGERIPLEFLD